MPIVLILDAENFGLSPAEKKFNLVINGMPTTAKLEIEFTESFGFGLVEAFLNGVRFKAQSSTRLTADVQHLLKTGENKLSVIFNALQIFGNPLGQTTISARITYQGASIVEIPSVSQGLDSVVKSLSKNAPTFIAIIIAGAIALGSVAFISSRVPSLGSIKIKNPNLSGLKHMTANFKSKVLDK